MPEDELYVSVPLAAGCAKVCPGELTQGPIANMVNVRFAIGMSHGEQVMPPPPHPQAPISQALKQAMAQQLCEIAL